MAMISRAPRILTVCAVLFLTSTLQCSADPDRGASGTLPPEIHDEATGDMGELPLVMVGILARNTAHTLPDFFGYLESLDYPKHRMSVWIRTDHNEDDTLSVLTEWTERVRELYSTVTLINEEEWLLSSRDPLKMTDERYERISQLRQDGLEEARRSGARYLLWLDCDVFLLNNQTLRLLIEQQKPVIAPVLMSGNGQAYSNFWCGQNEQGYYKRTPEYIPILTRDTIGCFKVPVVYAAVLIDLHNPKSEGLVYWPSDSDYTWPMDDVLHFSYSAKKEELDIYALNIEVFGYTIKSEEYDGMAHAVRHFINFKMKTLVNHPPVPTSQYLNSTPSEDTGGVDKIFMIGLERRPDRRNRMLACLNALKLNFTLFDAIDGKKLNQSYLDGLGIRNMPGWKDPWGERPMTFGEVGCFLSHYFIWQKMLEQDLQKVLVLEDDVDFEPDFRENLREVLDEAQEFSPTWDLIYVGRKALNWEKEKLIDGAKKLVIPHYSYWTLGYLLSNTGARKLLEAQPFNSLLPVDEYLPIMFNTHPEKDWAAHFANRNLEAYSAYPLLVNPTHYVGDAGWFSDTEPPVEVLEKIRKRKLEQEKKEMRQNMDKQAQQEKIKQKAIKRQIEAMRAKLKPKTEL